MKAVLSQFRRIYSDHGEHDHDFSAQEIRLHEANLRLANATRALVRSSVHLNDVLIANGFSLDKSKLH